MINVVEEEEEAEEEEEEEEEEEKEKDEEGEEEEEEEEKEKEEEEEGGEVPLLTQCETCQSHPVFSLPANPPTTPHYLHHSNLAIFGGTKL
ncbi:hypothetical protein Pcinc_037155 [Petrolisthes cinctipes]|uniref:Uncharacterized protein n=1 Tax=Petrolisthes cinctipes TaxID=88211 RepID=A0AAE1ELW7_PETCI|nr:hypothetical protein Pcinc_037155 [Petrolisthes cinctipes]